MCFARPRANGRLQWSWGIHPPMSFERIDGGHAALKLTASDSELLGLGGFLNLLECPGRSAASTLHRSRRTQKSFLISCHQKFPEFLAATMCTLACTGFTSHLLGCSRFTLSDKPLRSLFSL